MSYTVTLGTSSLEITLDPVVNNTPELLGKNTIKGVKIIERGILNITYDRVVVDTTRSDNKLGNLTLNLDLTDISNQPTWSLGTIISDKAALDDINAWLTSESSRIVGKQKDFYPDNRPVDDSLDIEATFDLDGNLKTRTSALTDEGTFRINFSNTSLRVSIGTCTFTNGSNIVTGTNFNTYDVGVGDYVNIDSHNENTLTKIESITLNTITLESNYTGATTTGAASRQLVKSVTGTGSTITVASGTATIAAGTTANSVSSLERFVDYSPLVFRTAVSFSQRIINQTIIVGLKEDSITPKWYSRFQIDGTTNTTIKCQTARNPTTAPSGNEIQETVITIPNGLTTASSLDYRIECLTEQVIFYINEIRVARHTRVIPSQYDLMVAAINVVNGATPPATNTNIVIDYITCKNHNKLEIGLMSADENIQFNQVPLIPFNYNVAGVIAINTDLLLIDCLQLRTITLQITSIGTTGAISCFSTNDLTVIGTAAPVYPIGGGAAITTPVIAGYYNIPTNGGRYLRIRLTTATTAGTTTLFATGSSFPMPLPLPTTQPVTLTGTTITGGQTANSTASTGTPVRVGGRVMPTTIATQETTLIAGDASELAITTSMQQVVKAFGTSELDVYLPITPSVTVTTPQSIMAPSGTASIRNYITQFSIQTDTLGAAGNMFILDNQGAIGTSVTIATPGVFTSAAHDLRIGDCIIFTSIGTITGISVNTLYYITATTFAATTFTIATSPSGTAIQITGVTSAFTFYRVFYLFRLNTIALATPFEYTPINPFKGISNSSMNVYFPSSLVTGTVYLNINGYRGF